MSLVEISRELEFVPNEQLLAMTKNPNSQYPSLLVLSEIQRRNKMDNIFKNQMAMQNKPTMSVAEETAQKLQNTGAVTTQNINPQMAPPVRKMQAGGDTSFAQDYQNYLSELALYDDALLEAQEAAKPGPSPILRFGSFLADAPGKLMNRYTGEGGGLNLLGDAAFFIPGGFALAGLGRLGLGALRSRGLLGRGLKGFADTRVGQAIGSPKTPRDLVRRLYTRPVDPKKIDPISTGMPKTPTAAGGDASKFVPGLREFSPARAGVTALAAQAAINPLFRGTPGQQIDVGERPQFTPRSVSDVETPKMSGLDMVRLGSIIGGSATQKELASGIGDFAKEKQLGKIAASDAAAESLLRQAQTGKALAEASNIPIKSLTDQIEALNKSYKDAFEAGETEEMARINMVRSTLINRLAMAQGLPVNTTTSYSQFRKTA